ncbi:MAG: carbohydrate-binding domain-containing protein, partial [Acidimicrobiales bacterium]|nr:carbohydrate-binding domain-containing protein [Acidimicrobiales bacterium]
LHGTLTDGQVVVDAGDDDLVRLVLDDVDITNSTGAALAVANASKAIVVVADGTANALADGSPYVFDDPDSDEPNATLFSTADLTITGEGKLTVDGADNDAIASKDGLVIDSATIVATAADDAIRGKDYLVVNSGTITATSGDEGLKSDNDEDEGMGYVAVNGGEVHLDAGGKGISATANAVVAGGELAVEATDDAVHSNANVTISGGTLELASADDAVHGDATLTVTGGDTTVTESYEGLESAVITIADGTIDITSSDDGINVAGGNDGSGGGPGGQMGPGGGRDSFTAPGGGSGGGSGSSDYQLVIEGGTITVDADGDGLDANGTITMTGGDVTVQGPTSEGNGALDYDGGFELSGGRLLAVGSAGMAQSPDASGQGVVSTRFDGTIAAGTIVEVVDPSGETLASLETTKAIASLVFSSPDLVAGSTYEIVLDGSSAGSVTA